VRPSVPSYGEPTGSRDRNTTVRRGVIVKPLSKVWGTWLMVGQYANAVLLVLVAISAAPADVPFLVTWKAYAVQIHATIVAVLSTLQGIAKALPDTDGDGKPDVFDDTPDGG
jgi:hypothetical protein